jgi:hypothetical protein
MGKGHIVVTVVSTKIRGQMFFTSLPFELPYLIFLFFCPLHLFNLPCYKYQRACYMPSSYGSMLDIFLVCYEWSKVVLCV